MIMRVISPKIPKAIGRKIVIRSLKSNRALSLTELLVAALLITITFSGASVLFMNLDERLRNSSEQLEAYNLAREGLEYYKNQVEAMNSGFNPRINFGFAPFPVVAAEDGFWDPDGAGVVPTPLIVENNLAQRDVFIQDFTVDGNVEGRKIEVRVIYDE